MSDTADNKPVKVTMNLPWKVWQALVEMAEEADLSKTEAIRRAISTEVFRRSVEKTGGRLMVEREDGSREPVHFPY